MIRSHLTLPIAAFAAVAVAGCGDDLGDTACTPAPGVVCTFAGTGVAGLTADGLDPLETDFYLPQDLEFGPDGLPYILDWNNHRVRFIDADGLVRTLIGTGYLGDAPDGPALATSLNHPTHISFSPIGELILSAWHNSKVLRYDAATQTVEAICGTGARAFNGDGLAAPETFLDLPVATAFAPDGRMYISDQANQRIRRIEADGTVSTVVGVGTQGYSGDGGPALEAEINLPVSQSAAPAGRIATDAAGNLFLADTDNHVVRKIDTDGIITTLAGTGVRGNGPDGPATDAALDTPTDVAVDGEGNVYIADTMNDCVRVVDTSGTITTFAGVCGQRGYGGDGDLAVDALMNRPYGVAVGPGGDVYVADTHNQVVRVVYR